MTQSNVRSRGQEVRARAARVGVLLLALSSVWPARADTPRQRSEAVRAGRELAEIVCSACHKVGPTQDIATILDPPAPSFQLIADRPTTTAAGLRRFMAHTDWDHHTFPMTMPDLMLEPDQQASLAAYIVSLRSTKRP